MKKLILMQYISRLTNYRIGIHRGRREYYYLVSSKTGNKYRPWVGIAVFILVVICLGVAIYSGIGAASVLADYETFGWWTIPLVAFLLTLAYFNTKAVGKLYIMFEWRPDEINKGYKLSEEEMADWDNWVH